ncbi:MAG: hypothetical protein ACI310_03625 [Bacilli bacterium]
MREEPSTLYRKNYNSQINNTPTRKEIGDNLANFVGTEERLEKQAQENYQKYGTGKFIPEGTKARLSAVPYPNLDNMTEGDKTSFRYGYYERGDINLKILIETGKIDIKDIAENIKRTYIIINKLYGLKEDEVPFETLSVENKVREMIRAIGFNDGQNENIKFEKLNPTIQNSEIYKEGFELGRSIIEINTTRKHR